MMDDLAERRRKAHEYLQDVFKPNELRTYYDSLALEGFKLQVELTLDAGARSQPGQIYAEIESAIHMKCKHFAVGFIGETVVFYGLYVEADDGRRD